MVGKKRRGKRSIMAALIAVSVMLLAGCQNDTAAEGREEYGSVETVSTKTNAGIYFPDMDIIPVGEEYFRIREEGENLVMTVYKNLISDETTELFLTPIPEEESSYRNEKGFKAVFKEAWCEVSAGEYRERFKRGVDKEVTREDILKSPVGIEAGCVIMDDEMIKKCVAKAEEESSGYLYVGEESSEKLFMLPVLSEDGSFDGLHVIVWVNGSCSIEDIATVYFDGAYGTRIAELIGERRNYPFFVDIEEDSIAGLHVDRSNRITADFVKEVLKGESSGRYE